VDSEVESTIVVSCSAGLVEYVRGEVEGLGYAVGDCHSTGVEIRGSEVDAMRLNLHLRTANNVLFLLKQFECVSPEELYREVSEVAWDEIISPDEYLSVVGKIDSEFVDNSM